MVTSSTGLSSRTAAALAYSGWWVTAAIIWLIERDDPFVRRHAAQALGAFGAIALLIVSFLVLALASLSFVPALFGFLVIAAAAAWVGGVLLWFVAIWKVLDGRDWRMPWNPGSWVEHLSVRRSTASAEGRL